MGYASIAMVNEGVALFRPRAPLFPIHLIATKPTPSYLLTFDAQFNPGTGNSTILRVIPCSPSSLTPHRVFLLCRYQPNIASVDPIFGPTSLLFILGHSRHDTEGLDRGDSPSRVHTFMYTDHLPDQGTVAHTIREV